MRIVLVDYARTHRAVKRGGGLEALTLEQITVLCPDLRVPHEEIFQQATDLPPADRSQFLGEACAGDDGLRREVESLLAHDQSQNDVLVAALAELPSGFGPSASSEAARRYPSFE